MNFYHEDDLSKEYPQDLPQPSMVPWHPEMAKMRLAYIVLGGITFIFILSILICILAKFGCIDSNISAKLFDFCITGLLPIVTLILGYYFSKS